MVTVQSAATAGGSLRCGWIFRTRGACLGRTAGRVWRQPNLANSPRIDALVVNVANWC